jgi:ABC-type antimicrobial peptide transport system permease subunit
MSYIVSRRTREIGIRIALGARRSSIWQLVTRQGMLLTLIGVTIGLPAAWFVATLCASFLYGIRPHDSMTFILVPLFLITAAVLACWIPAQRAAAINPESTLRYE